MEKSKLLLATYDARLTDLKIRPECCKTKVSYKLKMYDEKLEQHVKMKMSFKKVVAIEFRMNYFDNPIGSEAFGFYEIFAREEKEAMLERNFDFCRESFLFHGDYGYDSQDANDILNWRPSIEKNEYSPVFKEAAVEITKATAYMGTEDYRFNQEFEKALKEVTGEERGRQSQNSLHIQRDQSG